MALWQDTDLMANKTPDPAKAQGDTSIRSICPAAIADAVSRISVGNGFPKDGHVLYSAFQGQRAFLWNGPRGELKNPPLEGTESEWNVAASTLPLIVAGDSAAGKDNLKRVVLYWLHKLEPAGRPATRALLQGSITVTGLIVELLDNDNQLQIINGELEKVINRKTPRFTMGTGRHLKYLKRYQTDPFIAFDKELREKTPSLCLSGYLNVYDTMS